MEGETPSRKHKNDSSRDGSHNEESDGEVVVPDTKEVWSQLVSDDLILHQQQDQEGVQSMQSENGYSDDMFKKLDDVSSKMLKLSYEFKRALEEAKELCRQRRDQTIVTLGSRGEVIETVGLQPSTDAHNKKVIRAYIKNEDDEEKFVYYLTDQ